MAQSLAQPVPEYQLTISEDRKHNISLLKKCFSAIVDRKRLNLDMAALEVILRNELQLNLQSNRKTLNADGIKILPFMLVWYIKTWPGWQRSHEYFTGKLRFKVWYDKFFKYINLKMGYLTNNGLKEIISELNEDKLRELEELCENKKSVHRGQQTDNLAPKSFSPYFIEISAEPSLLNKIVFTEINHDSVFLKCHQEIRWENLSVQQLLSWPHIEVHLNSPLFKFTRKNIHEYRRQINLANTPLVQETVEYIQDVSIIDSEKPRTAYGLTFLTLMAKELLSGLEPLSGRLSMDLDVVGQVLTTFLQDVKEIECNDTIASNTSITFNIGKSVYSRNKKLSKSASTVVVSLNETIVPRVQLNFLSFTGLGYVTDTGAVSCEYLRMLKNRPKNVTADNIPVVTFSCNYCDMNFNTADATFEHLIKLHKMSQPVLCVLCKTSLTIPLLAENRWSHFCKPKRYK